MYFSFLKHRVEYFGFILFVEYCKHDIFVKKNKKNKL